MFLVTTNFSGSDTSDGGYYVTNMRMLGEKWVLFSSNFYSPNNGDY